MKSSRRGGEQGGNYGDKKKYGKSGDKWTSRKLDRKSSRGMIYENEELRIRTININAEVERGQSDIRKLRRENEQLRREIWSLRDEYDRLNKLLKTPKNNNESSNCENDINSESITEDSDSCDTCKENDDIDCIDNISDYNINKSTELPIEVPTSSSSSSYHQQQLSSDLKKLQSSQLTPPPPPPRRISSMSSNQNQNYKINYDIDNENDDLTTTLKIDKYRNEKIISNLQNDIINHHHHHHVNFDHLSIVSEENLTNSSDGGSSSVQQIDDNIYNKYNDNNTNKNNIINDKTSIEIGDGNDLQSSEVIPPLSHFENIINEQFNQNIDDSNYSTTTSTTTTTGETVLAANGWDFNIQSPFSKKKLFHDTSSSSSSLLLSSSLNQNLLLKKNDNTDESVQDKQQQQQLSPKHFFSPIKPFHITTTKPTITNTTTTTTTNMNLTNDLIKNYDNDNRPDICFANVLGSPYNYNNKNQQSRSICNSPTNSFQNGGNLEELLMDIESLSKDIYEMEIEKHKENNHKNDDNEEKQLIIQQQEQQHQKYLNKLNDNNNSKIINMNLLKNRKPYRSEMNLVLNYNGSGNNPIITTPIIKKSTSTTSLGTTIKNLNNNYYINDNQLNDNNKQLIPNPMKLLPKNLQYLDFDNNYHNNNNNDKKKNIIKSNQINSSSSSSSPSISKTELLLLSQQIPINNTNLIDNSIHKSEPPQPPQPPPPPPSQTSVELIKYNQQHQQHQQQQQQQQNYGFQNYDISTSPRQLLTKDISPISPITLHNNNSPLKIRRNLIGGQYIKSFDENNDISNCGGGGSNSVNGSLITSSSGSLITSTIKPTILNDDTIINYDVTNTDEGNDGKKSSSGSETTKHKNTRRVSILNFRSGNNDKKNSQIINNDNDNNVKISMKDLENERNRITEKNTISNKTSLPILLGKSLSTHDLLQNQKSIINNDSNSNLSINSIKKIIDNGGQNNDIGKITTIHSTPNSPHSIGRRNSNVQNNNNNNKHRHHHHRGHNHYQRGRKMSQDSSSPTTISNSFIGNNTTNNNKCSRRHSESTVQSIHHDNEIDVNHHNHHRIGLNDSQQDIVSGIGGGGGGGTSISERNSNSLASSRESSTSLSMRSQRRKISINSHNGGKIPWCGCWGNGCL